MYIRNIHGKNKDGSVVRYVQMTHNYWGSAAGQSRAKVTYNFGREEELDTEGLRRLIRSVVTHLGSEEVLRVDRRKKKRSGV
jgi:hypothetical protein